jgi:hypothetical protein
LFFEVNYFGTEKWKKNALEKMLNWKRHFFFWRKQPLSGRIFLKEYYTSPPYQQAKLKSTLFAFYYSMLLSQRKSKSSLNANVSRRLEELFWEVPVLTSFDELMRSRNIWSCKCICIRLFSLS